MARNPIHPGSKGGEVTTLPRLEELKDINTCRGQNHGLQQVRKRDDAPHHISPVHQDQAMDLEQAG